MLGELIGGRYRLVSQIGEGGHGVVFRAEQLGMSRPVALKLMQRQRLEAGQIERFEREAELVQRLSHPNTVRLLDHGVHDGELPSWFSELLEGRSLQQVLASRQPDDHAARRTCRSCSRR
ncbi:MAG: protein kinase [Polyangiaceae bacterium]